MCNYVKIMCTRVHVFVYAYVYRGMCVHAMYYVDLYLHLHLRCLCCFVIAHVCMSLQAREFASFKSHSPQPEQKANRAPQVPP